MDKEEDDKSRRQVKITLFHRQLPQNPAFGENFVRRKAGQKYTFESFHAICFIYCHCLSLFFPSFYLPLFFHSFPCSFLPLKIYMPDKLQSSQRTSSYHRLKAKLKRNPSSYTELSKKDWYLPKDAKQVAVHALKGGAS